MSSLEDQETAATTALISPSSPDSDPPTLPLRPTSSSSTASSSSQSQPTPTSPSPPPSATPYYTADSQDSPKQKLLEESEKSEAIRPFYIALEDEKKSARNSPRAGNKDKNRNTNQRVGGSRNQGTDSCCPGKTSPPRMVTSLEDISSLRLWKGIVAEFVGTMLLTLVGCGSCINLRGEDNKTSPVVQIALCFGLSVGTIVWAICHVSGGHINPAVTAAMLAARKISLAKAVFFVLFQLIGAVVGAALLMGLTPEDYQGNLGMTTVNKKLNIGQAIGVELFITFILVFTVFASCDGKRKDLNGSAPLTIGLSVTMCHLWAIDFTGSSMNTARSFGPALVMGEWDDHWVYWLGPILGGVLAGMMYEHLFAVNASLNKAKACLLSSDYDDDKYKANKIKVRIIEEDPALEDCDEFPLSGKDEKYSSDPSNV